MTEVGGGGEAACFSSLEEVQAAIARLVAMDEHVPLEWEDRALVLALERDPDRSDLRNRRQALRRLLGLDLPDSPQVVTQARANFEAASALPQDDLPEHGARWLAFRDRMRGMIASVRSPSEALRLAQTRINFEHRGSIRHEGLFCRKYQGQLRTEFPQYAQHIEAFSDLDGSAQDTSYILDGRPVSNVTFYLARIVLSCISLAPAHDVIVEIGGGYGAPARAWLRNPIAPPRRYVIVDLAESLFFAETILRREFGNDAVHYVATQDMPLDGPEAEKVQVLLCPVACIGALRGMRPDLIINTGSLQEMTGEWSAFYMHWIDLLQPEAFYSLNYYAQPLDHLAEGGNLCSPWLPRAWQARHLLVNPPLLSMQSQRNFLEALYVRVADRTGSGETLAEALGGRALSLGVLAELLEAFRVSADARLGLKIVQRIEAELPFLPKEALWLVELLLANERLTGVERRELEAKRARYAVLRADGLEGVYE